MLRGQVYYCDLGKVIGSEQGGHRPVLVIQNDKGNKHSPTTVIAPLTSRLKKTHYAFHVEAIVSGKRSVILLEQMRVIDKSRLENLIDEVSSEVMRKVDRGILVSLGVS